MKALLVALILVGIGLDAAAADRATDKADILATTQALFDNLSNRSQEAWRAVLLEEGYMMSFSPDRENPENTLMRRRLTPTAKVLETLKPVEQQYVERWVGEPTVLISGDMAHVWGAFDFHIDGKFSHCGINAIDMARTADGWRVVSIMWTNEYVQADCPVGDGQ